MENLNTLLVSGALVALLGVITMSLVQVSQALLGLRSRTLRKGLATVFYQAR